HSVVHRLARRRAGRPGPHRRRRAGRPRGRGAAAPMSPAGPTRVILADDHALFRQGLKAMLRLEPSVAIVGEVERVAELARIIDRTRADVLLLDLQMDRSTLADIEGFARRIRVVVVTASEQPGEAMAALRAGARAVVLKRFALETLIDAMQAVMQGHVWMPPALQARLTAELVTPGTGPLSAREREIVRLAALGLRNGEIADRLAITEA